MRRHFIQKEMLTMFLTNRNLNIQNFQHYMTFNHQRKFSQPELIAILKIICKALMRKINYNN